MEQAYTLREQPVFICGHPKSGTSLIRAVLDSHPQLIVYPEETIFFRRYLPLAEGQSRTRQLELAETYLIQIFTWNRTNPPPSQEGFPDRDYSHISYDAVRQAMFELVNQQYRGVQDILSAAILAYGKVTGLWNDSSRVWIEKSPYNEHFTEKIFNWWPAARCIHMVRDPRDNFISYQRKHSSWSPEFFTTNWKRSTNAGFTNLQRYGQAHYHLIRFEDLVSDPEKHLKDIIEFLGIEWDASLDSPTRAGTQWQGNSMFAEHFGNISSAPVGRWKELLPLVDALVIQGLAEAEMDALSYERVSQPRITQRFPARWRVATWSIRRQMHALIKNAKANDS
jgi:hypothetical protein